MIVSLVLLACAVGTALARRHQARKLLRLSDARSTSIAELIDLQETVAQQIGSGSFLESVKLSAELVCEEPLVAPWSGETCAAFTNITTALMEVREESTRTDSDGNATTEVRWVRRDQTLESLDRRCSFALQQGTQRLQVRPESADLELETVFSDVEPPRNRDSFNTRQLGIRRVEAILRPKGMVFVVAECSDSSGTMQLQAPQMGGLFVIRRGSEDDFYRRIRRWQRIWMLSTWTLTCAAAAATLASLLRR